MRRAALLFLLGVLAAPGARAFDTYFPRAVEDPESDLQNLIYYPHTGHCRASGDFSANAGHSGQTDDANGNELDTFTVSYYQSTVQFACGVEEGARIGIGESVLYGETVSTSNSGATTNNSTNGFSDPTIFATQRYYTSESNGLYLDGQAAFTPGIGRSELGVGGQTGNDLNGGWDLTVSAPSFWVWGRNEFEFEPELHRSFGTTQYGSTNGNSKVTSGFWSESFNLQDRFHLGDSWYLQPGLTFNLGYSDDTNSLAKNAVTNSSRQDFNVVPNIDLGYLAKKWLLFDLIWAYDSPTSHFLPVSGANTTTTQSWSNITLQAELAF